MNFSGVLSGLSVHSRKTIQPEEVLFQKVIPFDSFDTDIKVQ